MKRESFKSKNGLHRLIMPAALMMFAFYCGDPIPVEEMGNAKFEIARAETVKAEEYAKEKLDAAKSTLMEAHEMVSANKLKDAKEKADEAKKLAEEAFAIAVPELAKATKAEAEELLAAAEKAYAEEYAATEYENARQLLAEGDSQMEAGQAYEAYLNYENAREEAAKARTISEAKAIEIEREIAALDDLLKEAIELGAMQSTPDKVKAAQDALVRAKEYLANMFLKDASLELDTARENATEAARIAKKDYATRKRLEAAGAVEKAESELVTAKADLEDPKLKKTLSESDEAQEALKSAEETLAAAQESLANAGSSLENESYDESVAQSDEAIRLAKIVQEQIPELMVLIKTGKQPTMGEQEVPVEVGPGWKTYTVRLIPQRRDCLWRIAEYDHIYGNARLWTRIYKANKSKIKNPDLIYPGQIFDIPPKEGSLEKPKPVEDGGDSNPIQPERENIDKPKTESESIYQDENSGAVQEQGDSTPVQEENDENGLNQDTQDTNEEEYPTSPADNAM